MGTVVSRDLRGFVGITWSVHGGSDLFRCSSAQRSEVSCIAQHLHDIHIDRKPITHVPTLSSVYSAAATDTSTITISEIHFPLSLLVLSTRLSDKQAFHPGRHCRSRPG